MGSGIRSSNLKTSSLLYSTSRETRVGLFEASIVLRLKVAEVSGWGVTPTVRSLLQTLPVFSNDLFMLKATYVNTLYVIVVLKSINIFGKSSVTALLVLLMGRGLGSMNVLLDPKDVVTGFSENRFVLEILACAHKIWRKIYFYYKKKESEINFLCGWFS
jgi:hypothetical protein